MKDKTFWKKKIARLKWKTGRWKKEKHKKYHQQQHQPQKQKTIS